MTKKVLNADFRRARKLTLDDVSVLVCNIVADKLGDFMPISDPENYVEENGTVLYSTSSFEPKALISPEDGVVFISSAGKVLAYEWKSKAPTLPDEICEAVPNSERLSSVEIIDNFVQDVLPLLEEEIEDGDENENVYYRCLENDVESLFCI